MEAWSAPASWVLWEDADLLIIHKPSGLPTLPDGYRPDAPHVRSLLEPLYGRLWIVHRLDKDTSGVLALARSENAHRSLNTQFEQHTIRKIYHALALGSPEWETLTTSQPLRTNVGKRHRTIVDPELGKPAVTHLRILERFESCALIEAVPETGRTHQIRAHLFALGFPLAGDALYSAGERLETIPSSPQLARVGLHACQLEFLHPSSGARLALLAPYPEDLAGVLQVLRHS